MPTRTIAYLRVSTEKQADRGVSLDAQRHIRRLMAMVLDRTAYRNRVWDEHEAIVRAIRAGKVAPAAAAAGRHVRGASRMLLSIFDAAVVAGPGAPSTQRARPSRSSPLPAVNVVWRRSSS